MVKLLHFAAAFSYEISFVDLFIFCLVYANNIYEVKYMLNDEQMLQFIMKNAEMGCRGINEVKHYSNSDEMTRALRSQNIEYGRIYHNAYNMLRKRGADSSHVSPMRAAMARMVAKREMKNDSSNSHIAEMMIQGNTMGVQKIARHIRDYNNSNQSVTNLAYKLMETEQANIEQMKNFL